MLAESHPIIRRLIRFFALPYCFVRLINWKECTLGKLGVARDLLYIFFHLRYFPDNYTPCRLWEKPREEWKYYYGSSYHPWARSRLRREVQPNRWIGLFMDKAKCYEHFLKHNIAMPMLYGIIKPTDDFRETMERIFLAHNLRKCILKPVNGAAGRGVCLASSLNGRIRIQMKSGTVPLSEFSIAEYYLAQEVLSQDKEISEIYQFSVNTVRAVTLLTSDDSVILISAAMRFGVGNAFVDNWSAGGVAVGVDHINGVLSQFAYDKKGRRYQEHPDTGFEFKGFRLPFWPEVVRLSKNVQKASPFYKLLGLDIALTPGGPVMVEVNANSDIVFQEQTAGPFLKDRRVLREFARYDLLFNKDQWSLLGSR